MSDELTEGINHTVILRCLIALVSFFAVLIASAAVPMAAIAWIEGHPDPTALQVAVAMPAGFVPLLGLATGFAIIDMVCDGGMK